MLALLLRRPTAHGECRKGASVVDESLAAYKSIDAVMAAQQDLVEFALTPLRTGRRFLPSIRNGDDR